LPFVLVLIEVFGVLEEQSTDALAHVLLEQVGRFAIQLPSEFGQFLIEDWTFAIF
jgi:hypothetical protein